MSSMRSDYPIDINGVAFNLSIDTSKIESEESIQFTQLPGSGTKWDSQKIKALQTAFHTAVVHISPEKLLKAEGIKKGLDAINGTLLNTEPKVQAAAAAGFHHISSKNGLAKPMGAKPSTPSPPPAANNTIQEQEKTQNYFRPISPKSETTPGTPTSYSSESPKSPLSGVEIQAPIPVASPKPPSPVPASGVVSPSSVPDSPSVVGAAPKKKYSDSELINVIREEGQKHGGVDRLEQIWYPPRGFASVDEAAIAKCLSIEELTPQHILAFLQKLPTLTLRQYVERIGLKNTSGSCGNTTNVLEDLIHPLGEKRKEVERLETKRANNVEDLISALNKQIATTKSDNWFTRVDAGGHSFLIEYSKGKYRIHQSFWGSSTLAKNIEKNTTWTVKEFYDNLKLALAVGEGPNNILARKFLFGSEAVHPLPAGFTYRLIDKPVSTNELSRRLTSLTQNMVSVWQENENLPMSQFLVTKATEKLPGILEYNRTGKNSVQLLIDQKSIMDREEGDLPENLEEFDKAISDGHLFSLRRDSFKGRYKVEKTDQGYIFSLQ